MYFRNVIIAFVVFILSIILVFFDINIISDFFYNIVSGLNANNFFGLMIFLNILIVKII